MANLRIYTIYKFLQLSLIHTSSPTNFLNLNHKHLEIKKGIYSKHKLNQIIPNKHKLISQPLKKFISKPEINFPIILKPDWGESSLGIKKVNNKINLDKLINNKQIKIEKYFVQQFNQFNIEYDIVFLKNQITKNIEISEITTVSTTNKDKITGINHNSNYKNITSQFSKTEIIKLQNNLNWLNKNFNSGKITLKSNSNKELLNNNFKVIETNILFPLPNSVHTLKTNKEKKKVISKHLTKMIKLSKITKKEINLFQTIEFYLKNQIHKFKLKNNNI